MRNILIAPYENIMLGLKWLGAIMGLGTLAYAIINMLLAQRRPTGQQTGAAQHVLRTPYLIGATFLFILAGVVFWKPLPINLPDVGELSITVLGGIIMLPSLGLYIWGMRTLGMNFNASSGFGVRLVEGHVLITHGPYAYLRHPMYLAVILIGWGGLLLYRTWTMLTFAVMMFGLLYRGHMEEEALRRAFGVEWEAYENNVPEWIPRLNRLGRKSDH